MDNIAQKLLDFVHSGAFSEEEKINAVNFLKHRTPEPSSQGRVSYHGACPDHVPVFESPKPAQEGGDDGDESGDVVEVGDDDNNTASTPPPAPVLVATLSRDDAENKTVSHTKPKVVVSIPEAPKTKDKTPRKPTYSTQSQRVSVSPPGQPSRPILQVSAPVPAPPPAPVPDVVFGVGVGKGKMPKPSEAPVQAPVKLPGLAGGNTSAQNSVNPNPCMTEFEEAITKVHLVMEEQQEGLNNHKRILKSMKDEQARDSNSLASFSRKYTEAMISSKSVSTPFFFNTVNLLIVFVHFFFQINFRLIMQLTKDSRTWRVRLRVRFPLTSCPIKILVRIDRVKHNF